ncbi:MAG: ATP-binding protein [Gammaproteobacteria bacterium]|nr:ATP-binding protein [Gammaproteobacteria bacterium]
MRPFRNLNNPKTYSEILPVVHLWITRILFPLGGHLRWLNTEGFTDEALAIALGLGSLLNSDEEEFHYRGTALAIRKFCEQEQIRLRDAPVPALLQDNIGRLETLVGLTATDCRILEFVVLLKTDRVLEEVSDYLSQISSTRLFYVLSVILNIPEPEIRAALSLGGVLARSGLLSIDHSAKLGMHDKLDLLSDVFADMLFSTDADPVTLMRDTVSISQTATLAHEDYSHLEQPLTVLCHYLQHSLREKRKGVNVFVYGSPGTGKTQLAKVLAKELDCTLFEVASEDDNGDPITGERRLRAYRSAQCLLGKSRALLLFDEVEDVFSDSLSVFGDKSTGQIRKGWINRSLEENTVPTIWVSNSRYCLDPAFLRRFDIVLELPVPPKRQREKILQNTCGDLVDASTLGRLAESERLAPAVVARAAEVTRCIRQELGTVGASATLELLIGNTLEAQGHKPPRHYDPNRASDVYDPIFINSDANLVEVGLGLSRSMAGRLCLYGPPGTGKTAYARWLADQLGIPLLVKRASDILGMYVGESEKNMARAFQEAERDGALLLIDEVDSFLQDRRSAQQSWEVSHVNEMLTQMESFPGIFIASTNLMSGLDQAALRRFDLKVKFDFLSAEQSQELLRRFCQTLALEAPLHNELSRLSSLQNLTPGDFAAVIRQSRFRPIARTLDLVTALEAECTVKEGRRSAIGFLH